MKNVLVNRPVPSPEENFTRTPLPHLLFLASSLGYAVGHAQPMVCDPLVPDSDSQAIQWLM
jgi:hypothetical protein